MRTELFLTVILVAGVAGPCSANPVAVGPNLPILSTSQALLIDFGADLCACFVAFVIIRRLRLMTTWRFAAYFPMIYIAGLIVDVIALIPVFFTSFLGIDFVTGLMYFLTAAFMLYLYNSFIAKKVFQLENLQAAVIGITIAVLTNPVLGWFFFSHDQNMDLFK